jgi:pimeloyl-ACP methyl ester carboxylesterase
MPPVRCATPFAAYARRIGLFSALSVLVAIGAGCEHPAPTATATRASHAPPPPPREHLIHLPGIAGEQNLDRRFVGGLHDGGYAGTIEIFDWPGDDPGMRALVSRQRNERQADVLAARIRELLADDPTLELRIVAHSGGAGIATWALERLPDGVQIESLVLIAPALSQRYDLSAALRHVRGKAYAFTSENDVLVLGAGTMLFGTIDGVKEQAAGMRGFTPPDGADEAAYAKLVQLPYTPDWMAYDNIGDHIGPMTPTFAEHVVSAILRDHPIPATQPAAAATGGGDHP